METIKDYFSIRAGKSGWQQMATSTALATQLREIVDHILLSMAQFIGKIKYKFGRYAQEIVPFNFCILENRVEKCELTIPLF